MGISIAALHYLEHHGHLSSGLERILDIGSQNLFNMTVDEARSFLERFAGDKSEKEISELSERLSYFSYPRPQERTTYLSELIDATTLGYHSFDICPALNTEIFDFNFQNLPTAQRDAYDVVLNFGTTEHIVNQFNCFETMHDALATGGVFFHQLPSTGWIDHGYYAYHKQFFEDLAEANQYEILDLWYTDATNSQHDRLRGVSRQVDNYLAATDSELEDHFRCFLINVVMRKNRDEAFQLPNELRTSHAGIDELLLDVPREAVQV